MLSLSMALWLVLGTPMPHVSKAISPGFKVNGERQKSELVKTPATLGSIEDPTSQNSWGCDKVGFSIPQELLKYTPAKVVTTTPSALENTPIFHATT